MVFSDFYLPGHKSGGGMWTVVNLVDRFCKRFDFYIVTRNHDGKQDKKPYMNVRTGEWNTVGNAQVFFYSGRFLTEKTLAALVNEIKPDIFFLNSVFATPSIEFLRARRRRSIPANPLIIASCGELSKAALALKPLKKWMFLRYSKTVGLFNGVIWKASSDSERDEILSVFGPNSEVWVASDLPPQTIIPEYSQSSKPEKHNGSVKLVFVSRLVRIKNIHYLLEKLKEITNGEVDLEIIGAHEDEAYWSECKAIIAELPSNIKVDIRGAMQHSKLLERLAASHFFVLPTLSENFGYVFIEALAAGCPLLISDRTIWSEVESAGAGWMVPLESPDVWLRKIKTCIAMEQDEFDEMSIAAREYAVNWLADPAVEKATRMVLDRVEKDLADWSDGEIEQT